MSVNLHQAMRFKVFLAWVIGLGTCVGTRAQHPTIHSMEDVQFVGPGQFQTPICEGGTKHIWTDSSAGYTFYAWSTGDSTPFISFPTPTSAHDTLYLTVGIQGGGSATSTIFLVPSGILLDHRLMNPASGNPCPGNLDFVVAPHFLDSILTFSNGINFLPAFGIACNEVTFQVPTNPGPTGIRYLTNGCIVPILPIPFTVFDTSITPTVTLTGNTLTATHPLYQNPLIHDFEWFQMGIGWVGSGVSFTPSTSGQYSARLKYASYNGWGPGMLECEQTDLSTCYSARSGDVWVQTTQMEDLEHATFAVYPNPTTGLFRFHSPHATETLTVYDLSGRLVKEVRLMGENYDVLDLKSGTYILHWEDPNSRSRQTLLVVSH